MEEMLVKIYKLTEENKINEDLKKLTEYEIDDILINENYIVFLLVKETEKEFIPRIPKIKTE